MVNNASDAPDLSQVDGMIDMFLDAGSFNADLSGRFAQLSTTKMGSEQLLDINHLPLSYEEKTELKVIIRFQRVRLFYAISY